MMKKAICWILVAAIMLGFMGMIAFSVFAEPYVSEDYITADAEIAGGADVLQPGLGTVVLIPTGFEVGKPIAGATISLPEDSPVTLGTITIMDQSENVLTEGVFEDNKNYWVELELLAKEGYHPSEIDGVSIEGISGWGWSYWDGVLKVSYNYSTCEPLGTVVLTSSGLEVGKPMSDVKLEIAEGSNVTLDRISVVDPDTYETLTGNFESGRRYRVVYDLRVNEGYMFEGTTVILNGGNCDEYGYNSMTLDVVEFFNTGEEIKEASLTVREPEFGASAADCTVTTDEDTYTVEYKWIEFDSNTEVTGVFLADCEYQLEINLIANEGYQFSDDVAVTVNGNADHYYSTWVPQWNDRAVLRALYDFRTEELTSCDMEGAPYEIEPGAAEIPELNVVSDGFAVTDIRWVDADKNPVTGFEDGKIYYLEVTLAAAEGYVFGNEVDVWSGSGWADETVITGEHEAKAWFYYSLLPSFSTVELTVTGVEVGKPVDGVTVVIPEDANYTLSSIGVYDTFAEENVTEGNFQDGHRYQINYWVYANDGYGMDEMESAIVNGQEEVWFIYGDDVLLIETIFSTCAPVGTVELTSSGVEEGAAIADVKLEVPEDAKVTLESISVSDSSGELLTDGTFQKNGVYTVMYTLKAKEGYSPEEGIDVILNGDNDVEYYYFYYSPQYIEVYEYFSTCEVIDEIRISFVEPVIGASYDDCVFTAPEDAGYTVSTYWYDQVWDPAVNSEVFQEDHRYGVILGVFPKEGYSIDENAVILVNGQQDPKLYYYAERENGSVSLSGSKEYFFGDALETIELTMPVPEVGALIAETVLTAPEDAQYEVYTGWKEEGSEEYLEDGVFEAGKSYRLYGELIMAGFGGFEDVTEVTVNAESVEWWHCDDLYNGIWFEATYYVASDDTPVEPDTPDMPADVGDLDGVAGVNEDDAIYLLQYVLLPDLFPVEGNVDFDKNDRVDEDDAIYLLQHVLMPDLFPLA